MADTRMTTDADRLAEIETRIAVVTWTTGATLAVLAVILFKVFH